MESETILQVVMKSSDTVWNYRSQEINKISETTLKSSVRKRRREQIYIKSINVSTLNIKLTKLLLSGNRLTLREKEDDLIHISFQNLCFPDEKNKTKSEFTEKYIERLLKTGVTLNNVHYTFFGHSNSQLQSRSCFLLKQEKPNANFNKIINFGGFSQINSVSKRAKRIGLLFSSADLMVDFNVKKCKLIEDIERNNQIFSDGCGSINRAFAEEIAERINRPKKNRKALVPSVFQIRFMGYKGVLVETPDEEMQRIVKMNTPIWMSVVIRLCDLFCISPFFQSDPYILFRKSMKKFDDCLDEKNLCVLDYSKPLTYGKLNGELITLLSTLKIPSQIFVDRLKHHLQLVENCTTNNKAARELAILKNKFDLTQDLIQVLQRKQRMNEKLKSRIQRLQKDERALFFDEQDKSKIKVQIFICDSRILFGVCDYSGKLKEGQCFVQYSELCVNSKTGKMHNEQRVLTGKILVGRNPCLHPGDIQTFEAVDIEHVPELMHLSDCIVFSVHGEKTAASLMSGGDLDGDRFFVCWDKHLIPERTCAPVDYSKLQPILREKFNITQNDMIHYFAHYNNFSLGQLKNLYLDWVRSSTDLAHCKQCTQINELFSKCVDGERVGIPEHLRRPPSPITNPPFILDVLEDQIKTAFPIYELTPEDNESDAEDDEIVFEKEKMENNNKLLCYYNLAKAFAQKLFAPVTLVIAMLVCWLVYYIIISYAVEIATELYRDHKTTISNFMSSLVFFIFILAVLNFVCKDHDRRRRRRHLRSVDPNDGLNNLILVLIAGCIFFNTDFQKNLPQH